MHVYQLPDWQKHDEKVLENAEAGDDIDKHLGLNTMPREGHVPVRIDRQTLKRDDRYTGNGLYNHNGHRYVVNGEEACVRENACVEAQ